MNSKPPDRKIKIIYVLIVFYILQVLFFLQFSIKHIIDLTNIFFYNWGGIVFIVFYS